MATIQDELSRIKAALPGDISGLLDRRDGPAQIVPILRAGIDPQSQEHIWDTSAPSTTPYKGAFTKPSRFITQCTIELWRFKKKAIYVSIKVPRSFESATPMLVSAIHSRQNDS